MITVLIPAYRPDEKLIGLLQQIKEKGYDILKNMERSYHTKRMRERVMPSKLVFHILRTGSEEMT